MDSPRQHLVGGNWIDGNGDRFESLNPATNEAIWTGNAASAEQVREAVASSAKAQPQWRDVPLAEREAILRRFAEIATERKDGLAALIRDESGKPTWDAATEAGALAAKVSITIDEWHRRLAERSFDAGKGVTARLTYEPLGVLGVIGPFNFPMHLPNGHIIPALLAGNSVVFKPSELTPACGELLVRCYLDAGVPAGVVQSVQGGREVGEALADSDINGLLFTGGVKAGLALHKKFGDHPEKLLALELGGNNPLVVHSLSDVATAVDHVVQSAYVSAGQRCTCARRLIVTDAAPTGFVDQLAAAVGEVKVNLPDADPQPFMGPLISAAARDAALEAQQRLIWDGVKPLVRSTIVEDASDCFMFPGLLDVTGVDVKDEEIFGPLLQLIRVPDLAAAIVESNRTRFGLAAGILTDDRDAYEHYRQHVRSGLVNWNRPLTGASGKLPFGGVGLSGNFRPSGAAAIDYCTFPKASLEAPPASDL